MIYAEYGEVFVHEGIALITKDAVDFKITPTLAAGDVKISKDHGAAANLATLPDVQPAGGSQVRIQCSAAELTAGMVVIDFVDQTSPKEWEDQRVIIYTRGHQSAFDPNGVIRKGTAQAGAGSTITLDAAAVATDNWYRGAFIYIKSGTGSGQYNFISSYVGSSKVATVLDAWLTNPDNTSVFVLYAGPAMLRFLTVAPPTAATTAAAVRTELTAELAHMNADISSRATPAQVNTEADTALSDAGVTTVRMAHLDADMSSRLATSGYTAPPSAASIASATRTELTTELAHLNADISSRLASSGYTAPNNPTNAAIASAVRTNLTTELGYLDVAISSRSSQTSVDDLPTNAELATALSGVSVDTSGIAADVRTELTAELDIIGKLDTMMEADGGNWMLTEDALQQAPTGSGASAGTIASAVRTELTAELAHLNADVSSRSSASALATAQTAITAIQGVTAKLDTTFEADGDDFKFTVAALDNGPSGTGASAGTIASAVRTELAAELAHMNADITSRATAAALATAQTAIDAIPTNAELATALSSLVTPDYLDTALTGVSDSIDGMTTTLGNHTTTVNAAISDLSDMALAAADIVTPLANINTVATHLATMITDAGTDGVYEFKAAALINIP